MKTWIALVSVVFLLASCVPRDASSPFNRLDLLTWGERMDYYSIVGPDCSSADCRAQLDELRIVLSERIDAEKS